MPSALFVFLRNCLDFLFLLKNIKKPAFLTAAVIEKFGSSYYLLNWLNNKHLDLTHSSRHRILKLRYANKQNLFWQLFYFMVANTLHVIYRLIGLFTPFNIGHILLY
jgi:hypothetical protein